MAERVPQAGNARFDLPRVTAADQRLMAGVLDRQPRLPGLSALTRFEIDAEVWRLAVLGWDPRRVADALGLAVGDVSDCLDRYMMTSELTEPQKVAIMVAQLDEAIRQVIDVGHVAHYKFHKGQLITMFADPERQSGDLVPVVDTGPVLDAAKTLAVLLDRKARLLGLDAPEKHEHSHRAVPLPQPAQAWLDQRRAHTIEGIATDV